MKRRRLSEIARLILIDCVENLRRRGPCSGRGGVTYTVHGPAVEELRSRGCLWVVSVRDLDSRFPSEPTTQYEVIPSPRGERIARTIPPMSRGERLFRAAEENPW